MKRLLHHPQLSAAFSVLLALVLIAGCDSIADENGMAASSEQRVTVADEASGYALTTNYLIDRLMEHAEASKTRGPEPEGVFPGGRSFYVDVTTQDGFTFTDCLDFNNDNTFAVEGLGPGTWAAGANANSFALWTATASGFGITLLLEGVTFFKNGTDVLATVRDQDSGASYVMLGRKSKTCDISRVGASPWAR